MNKTNTQVTTEGKKLPQYIAALAACLGSLAAGAILGWTANISEDMKRLTYNGIEIDDDSLGWIGSLATLGATVSCIPAAIVCDWVGRKKTMLLLTLPFMLGWLLIIFGKWLWMIYVGRFLSGMAGGAFCVSAPIYISEITDKKIRGALASYFELLLTVGILVAYVVAMFVNMNVYTIIMAVLPLVFAIVFVFQPESPVYYATKGDDGNAKMALLRVRGKYYDVETELTNIKLGILEDNQNKTSIKDSIKKKGTKKAIFVCFFLMLFQQIGGVNAIVFYTAAIFESTGVALDAKVSTLIFGALQAGATFLSTLVVDKLGRRILLLISNFFSAIAVTGLAVFFTLQDRKLVDEDTIATLGFLPIASLSIYITAFAFGMGPLPWVVSAELFPPEINSLAVGCSGTVSWFMAFVVTKFYFNLQSAVGSDVTFYIFALMALLATIFVYLFLPETKGKSLAEIQLELNR